MGLNKRLIDQAGGAAGGVTNTDNFAPVLYTGNGTTQSITSLDFQPDLVWIKNRDAAVNHKLLDSIRFDGTNYEVLESNTTGSSAATTQFSSFDSNGFTLGGGASAYNGNGVDYVAWCWKGGGAAVSNTDGSITSQVSANQDAGFSIVKLTTSSNGTIGHGLSAAPQLIITKLLNSVSGWNTYNETIGNTKFLHLNSTAAAATAANRWNSTSPTSSTFVLGSDFSSGNPCIAYCFHSVDGYQKVGSYTGTGSSGNTVTTGFDPRFILFKNTNASGQWWIHDSVRGDDKRLFAEVSNAESTSSSLTTTTTGFTLNDANSNLNASGNNYIYLAIA